MQSMTYNELLTSNPHDERCMHCIGRKPHYPGEHVRSIMRTESFRANGVGPTMVATQLLNPSYAARLRNRSI